MWFFRIVRRNEMRKLTEAQGLTTQRCIELAPGIQPLIEELSLRFCEKFGREPGLDDPIFFDPDADSPVPLTVERLNRLWEGCAEMVSDKTDHARDRLRDDKNGLRSYGR